ncbi:MAG: OST-HTH/LOTUS domain-containing protein, partial [Anaerolineae bacterium]|nr:OST-HTH/LOTUS domain-containing protein [Anaerolineae bacterium]
PLVDYTEQDVIVAIEAVVRATTKAYGWRHLGDIGSYLNQAFADFQPSRFGCKNLLQFIEKHPERFKVKWSAPSKKGASHLILESKKDIDAVHGAPPCPTDKKQSAELQYATDIANSRCLLDIVRGWLYNPIMPGIPMRVLRAARSFDRCYTVLVGESNEVCIIV